MVKPFMSRMDQLDAEVAQLKNELADLRTLVQTKSTTVHLLNADSEVVQNLADLEVPVQKMTGTKAIFALSLSLLMCAGLLDPISVPQELKMPELRHTQLQVGLYQVDLVVLVL